jgi:diketogulonate reductase-like aldo/keto reductase
MHVFASSFLLLASSFVQAKEETLQNNTVILLRNGVEMPRVNLGTCCGSTPDAGLQSWISAGGIGIDTAWDYQDQTDIARILKEEKIPRDKVFILSKVPAGFGNSTDCNPDPQIVVNYVQENLRELQTDYLDVVLIHAPCDIRGAHPYAKNTTASDQALWKGAEQVLKMNLTRSIGVSNYKVKHLESLKEVSDEVPVVNQCHLSISQERDQDAIDYCAKNNILYEAYGVLKGCPWNDARTASIASGHSKSVAQVCLRWTLQFTGAAAAGTGSNATSAATYAHDNLDVFDFELSSDEMTYLNSLQKEK